MYLLVGLGNPGSKYQYNWHNCGFMTLEVLAQRAGVSVRKVKFKGEYGKGKIGGQEVIFLRPGTYMNLSGQSVREAVEFYKIPLENVIIIYDDIDLPIGSIRVRASGGSGTHNGMKSIIAELGSKSFARVRIGAGPAPEQWDLADYVLSDIPKELQEIMFKAFVDAAKTVEERIGGVK